MDRITLRLPYTIVEEQYQQIKTQLSVNFSSKNIIVVVVAERVKGNKLPGE